MDGKNNFYLSEVLTFLKSIFKNTNDIILFFFCELTEFEQHISVLITVLHFRVFFPYFHFNVSVFVTSCYLISGLLHVFFCRCSRPNRNAFHATNLKKLFDSLYTF